MNKWEMVTACLASFAAGSVLTSMFATGIKTHVTEELAKLQTWISTRKV
jgi:hypothetical protein